jgi:hypothetical protein
VTRRLMKSGHHHTNQAQVRRLDHQPGVNSIEAAPGLASWDAGPVECATIHCASTILIATASSLYGRHRQTTIPQSREKWRENRRKALITPRDVP